ncbi:DUF3122 domain-containing protein [Allocoleopsis sp.]|uniref:DUF3122 domain-containing protein n=1 Tax=Allocoleopsis sp. TaxID=3088169 RepID=UPI002FD11FC0
MLLDVFDKVSELAHISRYLFGLQRRLSICLRLWGLLLLLLLGQLAFTLEPATAVLRQHQDAPGIMRYHSQQSLRDELGNAWQVILFKQITPGQPTLFNLRLVGFPGIAEVSHPQSLEITTARGQVLTAVDIFPQGAPAPNVGQYNFTDVLNHLHGDDSLTLSIRLKSDQPLTLQIPQSLVVEWQWLASEL